MAGFKPHIRLFGFPVAYLEGVSTAMIAVFLFRENTGKDYGLLCCL